MLVILVVGHAQITPIWTLLLTEVGDQVDRLHEPVQAAGGGLHLGSSPVVGVPLVGDHSPPLRTTLPRSDTDSRTSFKDFLVRRYSSTRSPNHASEKIMRRLLRCYDDGTR